MKNGEYILVIAPEEYSGYKYRGRYIYEHHLVWWLNTGEIIDTSEYIIHHKNENKHDNSFENLQKLPISEHISHHNKINKPKRRMIGFNCSWCGKEFHREYRQTIGKYKNRDKFFCSRSCGAKHQFSAKKMGA